ncbi:MAG: flavodoxin family protein [Cellulosilyticum sp.]|nr:flavodoxin family protein [Cellulosilyticum sp.]
MKVLLINGCTMTHTFGQQINLKLYDRIKEKDNAYVLSTLNDLSLNPCVSCDSCQTKNPGVCAINDDLNKLLRDYLTSDLVIIVTPIVFGTCNALTKAFLDRTQPLYMPYQKLSSNVMSPRYDKYPDIKFIGLADKASTQDIDTFKNTFLNCTLALQSKHRDVHIIQTLADLQSIHF